MAPSDPSSPAAAPADADAAASPAPTPGFHAPSQPRSQPQPQSQSRTSSYFPSHPPESRPTVRTSHDDHHPARRVSRKLQKRRRDGEHTPTMELPERLKDHGEQAESEEEVLQPQGYTGGMFMNMNQSIFGLIAAAGSQVDFADRFEGQSSDEEEDDDNDGSAQMAMTVAGGKAPAPGRHGRGREPFGFGPLSQTTILKKHRGNNAPASHQKSSGGNEGKHRRKLSENRLLRSVQGLSRLSSSSKSKSSAGGGGSSSKLSSWTKSAKQKESSGSGTTATTAAAAGSNKTTEATAEDEDAQTQQQQSSSSANTSQGGGGLAPEIEITRTDSARLAPVMSRMLEARAEMAARPSFDLERLSSDMQRRSDGGGSDEAGPTELAKKLKEIFEFDKPEEVIEEYPCWLLQHVLLQGYMYITTNHIAFYAYLPKKAVSISTRRRMYYADSGVALTSNDSTRLLSPATSPRAASGIPSSTGTGSVSKATSSRTIAIPRTCTSPAARSTSATASRPA